MTATDGPFELRPAESRRASPRSRQIGLRTVILLVAVAALVSAVVVNLRRINHLDARITALRPLVRELVITNSHPSAVRLPEFAPNDNRWEVYLPPGANYRLCLATTGTNPLDPKSARRFTPIGPGRHTVRLEQTRTAQNWQLTAVAGSTRLQAVEPLDWKADDVPLRGALYETSSLVSRGKPIWLYSRGVQKPRTTGPIKPFEEPTDAVNLWIERFP